jgi:hypothetical protein
MTGHQSVKSWQGINFFLEMTKTETHREPISFKERKEEGRGHFSLLTFK